MSKMERRFGDLPEYSYQRSPRLTAMMQQQIPQNTAAEADPMAELMQKMQDTQKTQLVDEPTNTAFQGDQFAGLAQILGG